MIQDIRLHGLVTDTIEYFATVAGEKVSQRFFYETASPHQDTIIRFFSPGNEFIIGKEAIHYKGNGGSFCEYMFGINQPIKDMIKKEVVNRLVMNGAIYEPNMGLIHFTDQTTGSQTYDEIFLHGNALANYFFFINDPTPIDTKKQQENFLKTMGKRLKHSLAVAWEDDLNILHEIFKTLNKPNITVFLFKIIHTANKSFFNAYKQFYEETNGINPKDNVTLDDLGNQFQISTYQQERIKIDVIYKHSHNKRLIDSYKENLVELSKNPQMTSSDIARLNRLRSLGIRQNIPIEVFLTIDELFLKGKNLAQIDEPQYLSTAREILEGLFLNTHDENITITKEDISLLLRAKLEALEKRDFGFEGLLLEIGKTCDDHSRETNDSQFLEKLGHIITFFDRCDATYNTLNQIVFMENIDVNEKMLRTVYNNKKIFQDLSPQLFKEIFINKILKDRYLTDFGRRKIYCLFHGLKEIENNNKSLMDVMKEVITINQEMKIYNLIRQLIKKQPQDIFDPLKDRNARDLLRAKLTRELIKKDAIHKDIPEHLFQKVIRDILQEKNYLEEILPQIIEKPENHLRENFLQESGLDRYYIEEVEKDHFEFHHLSEELLEQIQKNN
jgi:uncharacterized protein (TIGR04442 family)